MKVTVMFRQVLAHPFGLVEPSRGELEVAATMEAFADNDEEALRIAFRMTNNIDCPWPENDGVTCLTPRPRSMSVGDVAVVGTRAYHCLPVGWERVPGLDLEVDEAAELHATYGWNARA